MTEPVLSHPASLVPRIRGGLGGDRHRLQGHDPPGQMLDVAAKLPPTPQGYGTRTARPLISPLRSLR